MDILGNTESVLDNDLLVAIQALDGTIQALNDQLDNIPNECKCEEEKFALSAVLEHYQNTDISNYPVKNTVYKPYKTWLISYGSHDVHIKNMNNLMMSAIMTQAFDVMIPY